VAGEEVVMDEDGFWKLIAELEDAVDTMAMWSYAYDANKKDRDEAAKDVDAVKAKLRVWLQDVNARVSVPEGLR
jgi:predicted HNH restriction endonuclease